MKTKKPIIITASVLACLLLFLIVYKYIAPSFVDSYSLKGDYIPSIQSVLNEKRWVSSYTISTKNHVYLKKYEYKGQENVIEDLKTYTNYLIQMEQFEVLKPYDLEDITNTSIYLGKKSHVDQESILLVTIDYTAGSYTIRVSKKKGTLLQ
jgi:hypothetical protein